MKSRSNLRVLSILRSSVNAAGIVTFGVGLAVLLGWFFDIPVLKSFLPGLPAMRFNTALSLLLLGGSLWFLQNEEAGTARKRIGHALAGFALLISLLTLSEYLFRWDLGIDELIVRDLDSPADLFPGRMAPIATLCSGFSSVALLMLGSRISQYFSVIVIALSLSAIMNFLFDLQLFNRGPEYTYVAAHTSVTFLIVSLAIIVARPTRGMMRMLSSDLPGSKALRLLLPGIVILTMLMAWLVERLESLGILDASKESIFLVILLIFVYSPLIYFIARNVNRAEEKLLLSNQILERVNALVLVVNSQGSITFVSPSVKTILGFEPAELLGDGWWKISRSNPAEGEAEKERIVSGAIQNITISAAPYEREIQDRWGNKHWIMWMDALGPDSSVIGVGHDITERKRAEQKLMESETRYRQAIMAANAIPYSLDYSTNQYTFIGSGIAELTGYPPEELTPALLDSLIVESTMLGDFKDIPMREAVELVRRGGSRLLWQCDHRIHTRSGEERWFSDASIQILDDTGIPKGSVGIFQDITERKKSEQALRQSEEKYRTLSEELEKRVGERTADLNHMNTELERANRAKGEFLAAMSHELRTPLNSILGFAEILLEQRRGQLNEYQKKSLGMVETSGRHLLTLINDILDLSKIDAEKLDIHLEIIDVDEICTASFAFITEMASKKSITVDFEREPSAFRAYADSRRLKQILVNLLTNAVKFTPQHGQVVLEVHADAEQDLIQFSVVDNGIGIAEENLGRLFKPFVQVDSNLNRQYEGTGLGLTLVQRLADLHGGSVQVESEVGKGSRFTINLPWMQEALKQQETIRPDGKKLVDEHAENPAVLSQESVSRGTILLAEDNMANVLTIGEYLESHGYEIVVAHNGEEAIAKAQTIIPNLILMDIQMPIMDGLEAIQRLRVIPYYVSTPIIALTALAMPGDRERCLRAGADEYLSKPVSLKQLVQTIGSLIEQGK